MKVPPVKGCIIEKTAESTGCSRSSKPGARPPAADSVQLSQLLQSARDASGVGAEPEIDSRRVEAIRLQLETETYAVSAEEVADAILEQAGWVGTWLK